MVEQSTPARLVQQNHGESNDKGYLIWDIEDKNTWSTRHVSPLQTQSRLSLSNLHERDECQRIFLFRLALVLRLVSNNNLPLDIMRRAVDIAKHRFKPESISFLNQSVR